MRKVWYSHIVKVSEVAITNKKDLYISIWRDFQNILLSGSQQSDKDYPVDLHVGKKGIKNIRVSVCIYSPVENNRISTGRINQN